MTPIAPSSSNSSTSLSNSPFLRMVQTLWTNCANPSRRPDSTSKSFWSISRLSRLSTTRKIRKRIRACSRPHLLNNMNRIHRRQFIQRLGLSAASLPFLMGLPSLGLAAPARPRQRLVIMFSPNGTIPPAFWPDETGADFKLKEITEPLAPFKERMLFLKGVCNKIRGDGDGHMRGMSCLLTAIELFPGNIQGGSDTPAGWAKGISIDQEIKDFFQSREETRTRFGSLEFGVGVTDRADPWTRMSYGGPNQPIGPVSDPYQMYQKLYGQMKDKENLRSILAEVHEDLKKARRLISAEDAHVLEQHEALVRQMEKELKEAEKQKLRV